MTKLENKWAYTQEFKRQHQTLIHFINQGEKSA